MLSPDSTMLTTILSRRAVQEDLAQLRTSVLHLNEHKVTNKSDHLVRRHSVHGCGEQLNDLRLLGFSQVQGRPLVFGEARCSTATQQKRGGCGRRPIRK